MEWFEAKQKTNLTAEKAEDFFAVNFLISFQTCFAVNDKIRKFEYFAAKTQHQEMRS